MLVEYLFVDEAYHIIAQYNRDSNIVPNILLEKKTKIVLAR